MDGFGDNFVPNGDVAPVDPAAEFLAREQDELAGLEDGPAVAPLPESGGSDATVNHQDTDADASAAASADDVVGAAAATDADDLSAINAAIPPASDDILSAPPAQQTPERVVTPIPRIEPEAIRIWREEHQRKLVDKDAAEEKAKEALQDKAKQELTDWYRQHEEQVAKTRQANRCAEKELVADTERPEPGTEWDRIAKLCDFNPKTAKSNRDVSRMRSIVLHVKQNPPIKA